MSDQTQSDRHLVERPLSPHLQVYRWQITMWLSSLHRITGLFLSLGAFAFCAWLVIVARGPERYAEVMSLVPITWFKSLVAAWAFCFFFHLLNGVRHLVWDVGLGFAPKEIRATGWAVVALTVAATTVFSWLVIL